MRTKPDLQDITSPPDARPLKLPDEPFYQRPAAERAAPVRRWGSLLLLLGTVWLVFELVGRGALFGIAGGFVERSGTIAPQEFTVQRVVISGVGDEVQLDGASGSSVALSGVRHGFGWTDDTAETALNQLDVQVSQSGDTLTISVSRPSGMIVFGRSPYADLRLSVPADVDVEVSLISGELRADDLRGDLSVSTDSGAVRTEDTSGAIVINTSSGDVAVDSHTGALNIESISGNVSAAGNLADPQIHTVSGEIDLRGASGAVDLRSISGEIALRDARDAALSVESTSGDISFAGSLGAAESRITNISGNVQLDLANRGDFRLEASTLSGELRDSLNAPTMQRAPKHISGGSGATTLVVSTASGDVAIDGK